MASESGPETFVRNKYNSTDNGNMEAIDKDMIMEYLSPSMNDIDCDPPMLIDEEPQNQKLSSKVYEQKPLREVLNLPLAHAVPNRPYIIGHRGALYDELENTLAGFQRCLELGCDAVELDVYLLKDGSLVVFHGGDTVENPGDLSQYCIDMCGKSILDLEYQQTQELKFNEQFEEFGCDLGAIQRGRIPTLNEVLTLLKDTPMTIKIELKGEGTVKPTLKLVEEWDMVNQCHFSSFALERLGEVREIHPERLDDGTYKFKTGVLFEDADVPENFLEMAEAVGASEVHLRYDACTVDRIQSIHERKMRTMAWFRGPIKMKSDIVNKWTDVGNEDDSMYLAVAATGVQQLCLNRPSVAINLWNRRERSP